MRKIILAGIIVALLVALPMATVQAAPPPGEPPGLERAIVAQEAYNPHILAIPGVVGTAVSITADGTPVVKIFTETARVGGLPAVLDGVPVVTQVTGKLIAMKRPSGPTSPGDNNRNKPPQVTINSPADGATFNSDDLIYFEGTATDKEDKDLTNGIIWDSSLESNHIGYGGNFSTNLSVGTHKITASVTDSGGKTATDSITISVTGSSENSPPQVTINSPADGATFNSNDLIDFLATATDTEDGDISNDISWESDIQGNIGTGGSVSTTLSVGTHVITASVTDSGGKTATDSITISVIETSQLETTDIWPRPVPIGISTGNIYSVSAGTIACRVKDAIGNTYALSNTHVYAPYAIDSYAALGDYVMQPGRLDAPGQVYSTDLYLGYLFAYKPIDGYSFDNHIDAAIAATNLLDNTTPVSLGGYGIPNSVTVGATPGMAVQKFGRTTRLTKGTVDSVNATVIVGYGPNWYAYFQHQIIIKTQTAFIQPGDSGSLLVTDNASCNPVGLLFAGNSNGTMAIANPIDMVLSEFGVTIDGK